MQLLKRLLSAWNRHGSNGFIRLIGVNIAHYSRKLSSGSFLVPRNDHSEFDQMYGTDTESIREVGSLDIDSETSKHAVRYQPSPFDLARTIIHELPVAHHDFTFIDFGSGKGRVLLIAAELPFSAVLGIEFSSELCDIANSNIKKSDASKNADKVESIHADVTDYPLPDTPLVCYFYNPFGATIMQSVVNELAASYNAKKRDIYVIYVHPEHRTIFDESGLWDVVMEGDFYVVYGVRSLPETVSAP
jgi:predicted RNA methylase